MFLLNHRNTSGSLGAQEKKNLGVREMTSECDKNKNIDQSQPTSSTHANYDAAR